MWTCAKCGEEVPDNFDTCWKCQAGRPTEPALPQPPLRAAAAKHKMRVACRIFRGGFLSWDGLCKEAAEFATEIGPERVINISHSADRGAGVVTVWYWADQDALE